MAFDQCKYCSQDLSNKKWISNWDQKHHEEHHYNITICDCGKKNWFKTNFHSSGHDHSINDKSKGEPNSIESTIRKVFEKDYWK